MGFVFKNIVYESVDGVARIVLNRPPLNILNVETLSELIMALENAMTDETAKVVVITGAGDRAFSTGVDIKDHFPDKVNTTLKVFHKVFRVLALSLIHI